jgi:hypothetical protein
MRDCQVNVAVLYSDFGALSTALTRCLMRPFEVDLLPTWFINVFRQTTKLCLHILSMRGSMLSCLGTEWPHSHSSRLPKHPTWRQTRDRSGSGAIL